MDMPHHQHGMFSMNKSPLPSSIYEPSGAAYEYSNLACNIYGGADGKKGGCNHKCSYCYCPQILHMTRDQFFCEHPKPRPRILEAIERTADKMTKQDDHRRTLFSFVGDAYCHLLPEDDITRQALQIMVDRALPFDICTKGGMRAARDFDLLKHGGRLGVSLVWDDEETAHQWEPNASELSERAESMMVASGQGIYVWVSVEPVIDPQQALGAIAWASLWADEFRVGKINHQKELEAAVDWQKFTDECYDLLLQTGKNFMVKESLHPYLRGRPARYTGE